MLDHLDDIDSDFSVFHGELLRRLDVEDPLELGSPRFFQLAARLHHYDGAVRAALRAAPPLPAVPQQPVAALAAGPAAPAEVGGSLLEAMSDNPGFPGIEYKGRG